MASMATQARSLYRRFLRELPARAPSSSAPLSRPAQQKLSNPSPIQQRIRSMISESKASDEAGTRDKLQQAEQFVQYLQAQRMYATLVERYNPGSNMTEEERVRLTARRVGMDMPDEWYGPKN